MVSFLVLLVLVTLVVFLFLNTLHQHQQEKSLMEQFEFGPYTALGIAFMFGYSGIRLLPQLEKRIFKKLDRVIDDVGKVAEDATGVDGDDEDGDKK